jgi:AraC family chitin signaling transcriptional activator
LLSISTSGQELPPIEIYTPKMYGAENQNWSVSQSKEQYIYVANNKGLLEFNGAIWKLYQSPNETIMRSVIVADDLIYTGCSKEFGYWKRNEFGVLEYTSISQFLQIDFLEEEEFWGIIKLDNYILFQSLERIYIYNKKEQSYSIIESNTAIQKMFLVDDIIYFQKVKEGLYKIEKGTSKLVSDSPILKDNPLVDIYTIKGKFLIQTEENGFYFLEDTVFKKWDIPANKTLDNLSVFRGARLKDGSFIIGTRSNGIYHLTSNGELIYHINVINGLSNNTIHAIYEDVENNIWLALDNGINCVNIKSAFQIYNDKEGTIGTVYASTIYNGYHYLGTNQGLFCKLLNSDDAYVFVEGTQGPVYCLLAFNTTLFCGHNKGTFIIDKDKAELIIDIEGTWSIRSINKNLLLQGNYNGLNVIENRNGKWIFKNKIEGFNMSSRFFEIYGKNKIFVSHEYKGVYKIKVDKNFTKAEEVFKDSIVGKGLNSSLIKYHDDLLYSYDKGIFRYDLASGNFVNDSILNFLYTREDRTSGKLIFDQKNDILWNLSDYELNYLSSDRLSKIPKANKISLSVNIPRGLKDYENITHLSNSKYLIGTSNGYLTVDLDKLREKSYTIFINTVKISDLRNKVRIVNKMSLGEFENKDNNIEFNYNVPEFDKFLDSKYQYKLEGDYSEWSNWSRNSSVLFQNLSSGKYVFNVRAKDGNNMTVNVAKYKFEIQKPWFASTIAIFLYAIIVFGFSVLIHKLYKRHYRKQGEKLVYKSKRDLELKELENQQQVMRFNNKNLRQDIDNKNRELGISTMSLIRKNEFLNEIKNELKNIKDNEKKLKPVIRIIDKNLNDASDWNVFEEAFNNADKDFLKKIKTIHPSLTANDLRLCAYLRLNLSSKEIAPLFSISSKSVEVKRYRLRKKMDLSHESSLTDYILEI